MMTAIARREVIIGGDESGYWRYLFVQDGAKLTSVGDPADDYILFSRRKSVSMSIESPHYTDPMGRVYFKNPHPDSRIEFSRFERGSGIVVFRPSDNELNHPIASNRFALSYKPIHVDSDRPVEVFNNLFYWNYYAYYQRASYSTLSNNTFDENDYGCKLSLSYTGTPPYYCTLYDNLFTLCADDDTQYGIEAYTLSSSKVREYCNAFYGFQDNDHPYRMNGVETQTDWNDIDLTESPYYTGGRGYQGGWFLDQTGRAVDGGAQSSCDAGLRVYSTDYDGSRDEGQVDIGYHHPFNNKVIFVDDSYTLGDSDGSYAKPYPTIHEGWAAASKGKSVFALPGTYGYGPTESLSLNKSGVNLYGSGALTCFIESTGTPDEDQPLVEIANRIYIDLEGFTIRGRENEIAEDDSGCGGGICCENAHHVRICHCTITDNDADYGAGVYMNDSQVVIDHCVIYNNRAFCGVRGGGIYIEGGNAGGEASPWPSITNCIIACNSAGFYEDPTTDAGGGIACVQSSPTIENCVVANNAADSIGLSYPGGGVYIESAGEQVTLDDCAIVGNQARGGGGIYCAASNVRVQDSLIAANYTKGGSNCEGAGLRCEDSEITLERCTVTANSHLQDGNGGGIQWSGRTVAKLFSCVLSQNVAMEAPAIRIYTDHVEASSLITNCTVADNEIGNTFDGAAVVNYYTSHQPVITNCILWDNTEVDTQYDLWQCAASYSDVELRHLPGYPGHNNIKAKPIFVSTAFGGYHLLHPGSPCIDAGNNTPEGGLPEADIDSDPRKIHGGSELRVDMGADEVHPLKPSLTITKTASPTYTIILNWNSEYHCPYEIYRSEETFRDGMTWLKVADVQGDPGNTTSWSEDVEGGDGIRQRFYKVKDAGGTYPGTCTDPVGFVNVPISRNTTDELTLICVPLQTKLEEVNDGVGPMIAERLAGAPYPDPEVAHQLRLGYWDEQLEEFQEKKLWLNSVKEWVDLDGNPATDLIKRGEAIRLLVRGWDDAPPVITFVGYVPMDVAQFVRIREKNVGELETAWGLSYPMKTTLNDIRFLTFGAVGAPLGVCLRNRSRAASVGKRLGRRSPLGGTSHNTAQSRLVFLRKWGKVPHENIIRAHS